MYTRVHIDAMLSVIAMISFGGVMASITIRNLDDDLKAQLRVVAASHGHSMEEEARLIIRRAMTQSESRSGIGSRIHARFAQAGGADLEIPARKDKPRAADFAE
jgi:plasmid stability protein